MALSSRLRNHPPSMFTDEALMELPAKTRLTGLGLRHYVDDEGRGSARPALIRGQLWALDESVSDDIVEEHLVALEDAGYLSMYTVDGRTYLELEEWPSVDRGQASRLPPPPPRESLARHSRDPREDVANPSRGSRDILAVVGERGEEGERREGGGERAVGEEGAPPPTPLSTVDEPSPFCSKHPAGTERPCGPCGTARKRHDRWLRAQGEAEDLEVVGD